MHAFFEILCVRDEGHGQGKGLSSFRSENRFRRTITARAAPEVRTRVLPVCEVPTQG